MIVSTLNDQSPKPTKPAKDKHVSPRLRSQHNTKYIKYLQFFASMFLNLTWSRTHHALVKNCLDILNKNMRQFGVAHEI